MAPCSKLWPGFGVVGDHSPNFGFQKSRDAIFDLLDITIGAPPWLNGSTSTMRDWRSWVQFPWVTSSFNVDIARIFVFYLAMVRNCCGLLWRRSGGCSCLPYIMSAKAVRWVPLDRDWCTLYEINKSMFMFMFLRTKNIERTHYVCS